MYGNSEQVKSGVSVKRFILPLVTIYLLISFSKVYKAFHSPYFTRDEACIYWTESAFQYRYAKMVARLGALPSIDSMVEAPAGFNLKKNHPVTMEVIAGLVYRFLHIQIPFHYFLIIFVSFYSSLPVIPVFLLSSYIWGRYRSGILSSLSFSASLAPSMHVLNMSYELQDFSLGFILLHIYFFIRAEESNERNEIIKYSLLSGSFLSVAMASWHLSHFYYTVFLVYLSFRILFSKDYNTIPFILLSSVIILCSFGVPLLYKSRFFLTAPMLLNYILLIACLFRERKKRIIVFVSFLPLLLYLIMFPAGVFNPAFKSGILPLTLAKIRYLGRKPSDPSGLSWETLVIWSHPLETPTLKWTVKVMGYHILWSIPGIIYIFKRKRHPLFLFFTLFFAFSYLLFERMDVFLLFFLSVAIGKLALKKHLTLISALTMLPLFYYFYTYTPSNPGPQRSYLIELVDYVRNETEEDCIIMAPFHIGPTLLLWGDRRIIFHPKFESFGMVKKLKRYESLLFSDEDSLYRFAKENHADYLVISSDMLLSLHGESLRYRNHKLKMNKRDVLFLLHFHPERLKHFELTFSNPHYRVFRIVEKAFYRPIKMENYPVYIETNFDLKKLGIYGE